MTSQTLLCTLYLYVLCGTNPSHLPPHPPPPACQGTAVTCAWKYTSIFIWLWAEQLLHKIHNGNFRRFFVYFMTFFCYFFLRMLFYMEDFLVTRLYWATAPRCRAEIWTRTCKTLASAGALPTWLHLTPMRIFHAFDAVLNLILSKFAGFHCNLPQAIPNTYKYCVHCTVDQISVFVFN